MKYDEVIMEVVSKGRVIGHFIRKRTAEEYSKDYWRLCNIKKQFNKMVKGSTNSFKTPMIDTKKDE